MGHTCCGLGQAGSLRRRRCVEGRLRQKVATPSLRVTYPRFMRTALPCHPNCVLKCSTIAPSCCINSLPNSQVVKPSFCRNCAKLIRSLVPACQLNRHLVGQTRSVSPFTAILLQDQWRLSTLILRPYSSFNLPLPKSQLWALTG